LLKPVSIRESVLSVFPPYPLLSQFPDPDVTETNGVGVIL
jgi:hypothetical protein